MALMTTAEAQQLANAAILRQLSEGVIVTDAIGTIKFVNDAAAAIHGISELNVRPNAYADTYHLFTEDGHPYPSHELPLARAVRGETVKDARWRIRRPDGTNVLAIGSAQPLYGPTGQRIGAVLTLRDDTARDVIERSLRAREASLTEINKKLESHVTAAETAHRTTIDAIADAASEIKAALTHVLTGAEPSFEESAIGDAQTRIDHLRETASKMKTIVDHLLASTKVRAPS